MPPVDPKVSAVLEPDLSTLLGLFADGEQDVAAYTFVAGEEVPEPYRRLLVHEHHMTVTVEAHHQELVDVRIIKERRDGDLYARKILLVLQQSQRVVQYGIMRIRLDQCAPAVREAILAGGTPLGRILIEHDVLRTIEPRAFLHVTIGKNLIKWFGLKMPQPAYGRLALIHCDGRPAVELLEIVAPE